ncbi:MAG: hypothetical protein DMD51_13745 [Gemmatimonadetes bacterium]|nr:MAG: hypothetical protein DMD32_11200 [Gemmatimonadota bacterium]PYP23648.1 MAG: hypothetical protein DMD51_13745 [Gemmatimonadota bacterium]
MTTVNRLCIALLALGALLGGVARAQQGSVAGQVTDQASGHPLAGARVVIQGTALVTSTNAEGRYTVRNVPAGEVTVRATIIGYAAASRLARVAAGETATVDLALKLTPFTLDAVVSTVSGDQSRKETPNATSTVRADSLVQTRPITNMNDLLGARVPGVEVLPGNITGAGARVRIRGTSSLSLNNEPIYVIDGVRMESANNSSSIGIGGTNPSRVNDIDPNEIESYDVVKGPAASTLYGTAATNGVVVIKTKRGTPGPARFTAFAETGVMKDDNTYPTAYRGWMTNPRTTTPDSSSQPNNGVQCFLTQTVRAPSDPQYCKQDSITAFNLFKDPDATPLGTGYRQQYGLQVSGGSDVTRYFVSGEWEDERGLLRMPAFAWNRLVSARGISAVPYEQYRPNARRGTHVRANVQANLTPKIDLAVQTGFISSSQRLPQTDNNTVGLLSNGFGGPGFKGNLLPPTNVPLFGYRLYTPDQFFSETVKQDIDRFIGSGTANWRPQSWLGVRVVGGVDFTNRVDTDLCRRDQCAPISNTAISGFKTDNRTIFFDYTANADATASFVLSPTLTSRSTAGVQYVKNVFDRNGAYAENLAPGGTTVTAGSTPLADESTDKTVTLGAFVEQEFGYKGRLFVTAGLRTDKNSAFGRNFSAVYYPKLGVSWVISDEPFFPRWSWLSSARLRGAFGASGVQPGTTDALRYFQPQTANVDGTDAAAIVFSAVGNPDLKPERAREFELGGEVNLLQNRVTVELTYYNKRTQDALIARTVAPSVGASASRFENLGAVVNRGVEGLIRAVVIDRPAIVWDISANFSYNTNFIADMGGVPPIIGTTTSQVQGYPINGWWQRPYTFSDADGNGIITANEIQVGDSMVFVGYANPRWEITGTTGVDLLNRTLRIEGLFDAKTGFYQLDGTERIRCQSRLNCRAEFDPTAPLWQQAAVVALRESGTTTQYGYIERADFLRLREASVTYQLPAAVARAVRADRLSFTIAGRNLWRTTKFAGIDPEANYFGGATGIVSNFQTQPPPTYWTFRLNVAF